MVLVEGIGDELTVCVIVAVIVIMVIAAWQSTFVGERRRAQVVQVHVDTNDAAQPHVTRPTASITHVTAAPQQVQQQFNASSDKTTKFESKDQGAKLESKDEDAKPAAAVPGNVPSFSASSSVSTKPSYSQIDKNVKQASEVTDVRKLDEKSPPLSSEDNAGSKNNDRVITVKVKFLNDSEREIETDLSETIGEMRRKYFNEELASNQNVRFIFNGQILNVNDRTLEQCGISNNSIIHCLLTSSDSNTNQNSNNTGANYGHEFEADIELEVGRYVMPILGAILLSIWCFRLEYDEYFNHTSTFSLSLLTLLYGAGMFLVWRGAWGENNNGPNVQEPQGRIINN